MSEPPRTSPTAWPAPAPGGDRDLLEPVSGGDVHRAGHVGVQRQPRHLGAGLLGRGNDAVGARPPQLALGLLERRLRDDRDVRPQLARRHPQARRSRRARTARARTSARGQGRCEESRGPRCRPLSELLRRGGRRQRAHRRSRQNALASAALPVPPRSHSSRTATTSSWPWRSDSAQRAGALGRGGPGKGLERVEGYVRIGQREAGRKRAPASVPDGGGLLEGVRSLVEHGQADHQRIVERQETDGLARPALVWSARARTDPRLRAVGNGSARPPLWGSGNQRRHAARSL